MGDEERDRVAAMLEAALTPILGRLAALEEEVFPRRGPGSLGKELAGLRDRLESLADAVRAGDTENRIYVERRLRRAAEILNEALEALGRTASPPAAVGAESDGCKEREMEA